MARDGLTRLCKALKDTEQEFERQRNIAFEKSLHTEFEDDRIRDRRESEAWEKAATSLHDLLVDFCPETR